MSVQLDHLILRVNDGPASVDFYTRILGLTYEGERGPFSVIRVTESLTLQLAPWGTEGGDHLAFALPTDAFEAAFRRVRDAGIPYGDAFHAVGQNRRPGDEDGCRGPGKAVYLFAPNQHQNESRQ